MSGQTAGREPLPPITAELTRIGRVLHDQHPYDEDENGFAWWAWDAQNVLDHLEARSEPEGAIRESLIDSGYHDITQPDEMVCLERDVSARCSPLSARPGSHHHECGWLRPVEHGDIPRPEGEPQAYGAARLPALWPLGARQRQRRTTRAS